MSSDRRWLLNKKTFSVLRALGPGTEERWKYIYVGPKGVTATDTIALIRVSLPNTMVALPAANIFDAATFKKLMPTEQDAIVTMPEGLEAKTSGLYTVPNHDATIPKPEDQTATIAVNARRLIDVLKAALEVTEHARGLVRLRFYKDTLRIDAHRDNGGQIGRAHV